MSSSCVKCGSKALSRDDTTGHLVCDSCGLLQEFDSFEAQIGGISGPQGTFVRLGAGTLFSYRDRKLSDAHSLIDDVAFRLGLSAAKPADLKAMASKITEGEFGAGRWFSVFVGACAYVLMRTDHKPLPISDVCSVVGSDDHELGRMINRVVEFLDLRAADYPELDVVALFERSLRNSPIFAGSEKMETMRKQGIFLVQCMVKWSLTTGRRPVPLVAAVLAFVGELNGIEAARVEDLAKEFRAKPHTCKQRHRELLEALVKVAQVLPWGKNVTVKNIVKNAAFVIQYMEKKSMLSSGNGDQKGKKLKAFQFDLDETVSECLRKNVAYYSEFDSVGVQDDSGYFDRGKGLPLCSNDEIEKFKISPECLSLVYSKLLAASKPARESGELHRRERRWELDQGDCMEWWDGESELSKKLLLKQILEKDVGLDGAPPAFVASCMVYKKRRDKINAAKQRIERIMRPKPTRVDESTKDSVSENLQPGNKRKRDLSKVGVIDWEDLIIEALLLHKAKEEEIETGHYNALLDLYVFNSGNSFRQL